MYNKAVSHLETVLSSYSTKFVGSSYQLLHYYIQLLLSGEDKKNIIEKILKAFSKYIDDRHDPSVSRGLLLFLIGYEQQVIQSSMISSPFQLDQLKISTAKALLQVDPTSTIAYRVLEQYITTSLLKEHLSSYQQMEVVLEPVLVDIDEAIEIMICWIDYHVDDTDAWNHLADLLQIQIDKRSEDVMDIDTQKWQDLTWYWTSFIFVPVPQSTRIAQEDVELVGYKCIVSCFIFGENNQYAQVLLRNKTPQLKETIRNMKKQYMK